MLTDPIADMLTHIRNGNAIYRATVDVPYSRIKESIVAKLKQEGFIKDYRVVNGKPCDTITIYLKYGPDGEKIIRSITRTSKPGRRKYAGYKGIKKVLSGMGISIISTPKGLLTDKECRDQKLGGEVLCTIW